MLCVISVVSFYGNVRALWCQHVLYFQSVFCGIEYNFSPLAYRLIANEFHRRQIIVAHRNGETLKLTSIFSKNSYRLPDAECWHSNWMKKCKHFQLLINFICRRQYLMLFPSRFDDSRANKSKGYRFNLDNVVTVDYEMLNISHEHKAETIEKRNENRLVQHSLMTNFPIFVKKNIRTIRTQEAR